MTPYSLKVTVDETIVHKFTKDGFNLTLAVGVATGADGEPKFKTVAYTHPPRLNTRINWIEEYGIASVDHAFKDGEKQEPNTEIKSITFGQAYTQPQDWTNGPVEQNSEAPKNGFLYINQTEASPMLFKKFNGEFAAIYVHKAGLIPPGKMPITPTLKVKLEFKAESPGSSVSAIITSPALTVDMSTVQSGNAEAVFDAKYAWTLNSNN